MAGWGASRSEERGVSHRATPGGELAEVHHFVGCHEVGESVADLRNDVQKLLDDPAASAVLDRFFRGRSHGQDDAVGITGLARGAASIRRLVKQQGTTVVHLRSATTTAMTTPPVLVAVAMGLCALAVLAVIAVLGLVF